MNREIKFRVWDKVDYMSSPFSLQDLQERKIQFTQDCPVMQYTGLKDKEGKEIYEGDVLLYKNEWETFIPVTKNVVLFEYGMFKMQNTVGTLSSKTSEIEIIGNIYENPELIRR